MAPRRRAKRARGNNTQASRNRRPAYVSIFGSPKAAAAAPVKLQSTPINQSDSDPPSECSSPEPRRKHIRPAAAPLTPTPPTTQRPKIGRVANPETVARAFEFDPYRRLLEASPMAAMPATQTQSRLPPSTDARKAPRKATTPIPAVPGSSHVTKPQPKPGETKKRQRTNNDQPASSCPLKSVEKWRDAEAAAEAKAHSQKAVAVSAPSPRADAVPRPQRPKRPQSKFKYGLTSELDGIKRALGENDWTEYVILVEKHESGKMDGGEFDKQERRTFQTPTIPGLQWMTKELVVKQMIAAKAMEYVG